MSEVKWYWATGRLHDEEPTWPPSKRVVLAETYDKDTTELRMANRGMLDVLDVLEAENKRLQQKVSEFIGEENHGRHCRADKGAAHQGREGMRDKPRRPTPDDFLHDDAFARWVGYADAMDEWLKNEVLPVLRVACTVNNPVGKRLTDLIAQLEYTQGAGHTKKL